MDENNSHITGRVTELLNSGYDGVVALRERWGNVGPYVFTRDDSLDELVIEPRYPMIKVVRKLLKAQPGLKLGIVARGCDVRAFKALAEDKLLNAESVAFVGVVCSREQANECNCEKPLYTVTKCTGCWECVEKCPEEAIEIKSCCPVVLPNEFDEKLAYRRAIYTPYVQAVPRLYVRDPDHCLKLTDKLDCKGCSNICKAEAVMHEDSERMEEIQVGSIIVSTGFEEFDPAKKFAYGYPRSKNVLSSIEFERLLSASGPTSGHVVRPSDHKVLNKIAFIQCVGSRDKKCGNEYCSSVCCMYAMKEAVIAKEHENSVEPTIFYMDIRAHGKDFDKYVERAKNEYGVVFKNSRVSSVTEKTDGQVVVKYESEDGVFSREEFDLAVLSVGFEPNADFKALSEKLRIELNEYNFFKTGGFAPFDTTRPGIYSCGTASGPMDIPETVTQGSGAAAQAGKLLTDARNSLTVVKEYPEETDVNGKEPRIGVFVCHCGINIGGVVDVPTVTEYARGLDNVVYAEDNLYTCSQDTQEKIKEIIKEKELNRVIVASCTPRTHEPLFRDTIRDAGLNPYLFEMANIRDQCSWVHMQLPREATEKAKELVRMAVAKSRLLEPLKSVSLQIRSEALVIGGGMAGMTAALNLADQGYQVTIVEKEKELGGYLRKVHFLLNGTDPQEKLAETVARVTKQKNITVLLHAQIEAFEGFVGNFKTRIIRDGKSVDIEHGAVIVATGARESIPNEYCYGSSKKVVTQLQLEEKLARGTFKAKRVVMIQCVGSREEERMYCSRICCSQAVKNAITIRDQYPDTEVFILYRDMRTYGFSEKFYTIARDKGVQFIRYDVDRKPEVTAAKNSLTVDVYDKLLGSTLAIDTDLLVLAPAVVPHDDVESVAQMLKVPLTGNRFFLEAHMKLRPVDFSVEGVYLAGMAHCPKNIEETVAQAEAAAGRAVTVISKKEYVPEAIVASVDEEVCGGCGVCVSICSYDAPELISRAGKRVSQVNTALCKGCGACAMACPPGAIQQLGFRPRQITEMVWAALE